ncbi:MAG: hypothetical protein A3K83_03515 [Omnitrophica WOR_2 bacterium RBG_13_44_8b]|nr:MAG: hypothetical protein A3K83_03515 [Omnitrophica WOR_2 bacterium RBG_13_44_8b]
MSVGDATAITDEVSALQKNERLEEEFGLEDEEQALRDYALVVDLLNANYSLIADELFKLGEFKQGLAIDMGTGLGSLAIEVAKRYPHMEVIGIDISQKAIGLAGQKAKQAEIRNVEFQLADIHEMPFEDNSCDLVVSHGAMHHLRDISRAFNSIYRILKPGACAYLTDLRRDAPPEVVKGIEDNLPASQARAFINSIKASYIPQELEEILTRLNIKNFAVSAQKFSRETIIKNIKKLRESPMRSIDSTKLSQTVVINKA